MCRTKEQAECAEQKNRNLRGGKRRKETGMQKEKQSAAGSAVFPRDAGNRYAVSLQQAGSESCLPPFFCISRKGV